MCELPPGSTGAGIQLCTYSIESLTDFSIHTMYFLYDYVDIE